MKESNQIYNYKLDSIIKEENLIFRDEQKALLHMKKSADKSIKKICTSKGIIGFYKFTQGYYIYVITEIKKFSKIGRHKIFSISNTRLIKLFDNQYTSIEKKYKKYLDLYDMELGFYSSYSYDLTNPLNINMQKNALYCIDNRGYYKEKIQYNYSENIGICDYCEVFMWNYNGCIEFYKCINNKRWILPIIWGYIDQRVLKTMTLFISLILISRRSRHNAGTRYIKRGINEQGFVANYVETEQIVIDHSFSYRMRPVCSSFVQIRGSVPVFWYQEPNVFVARPPIQINQSDPFYTATKKHIKDLFARYGSTIFMINLVKKIEKFKREMILQEEFLNAVNFINQNINQQNQIKYLHFDMKNNLLRDKEEFVEKVHSLGFYIILRTGLFVVQNNAQNKFEQIIEFQNGIIRSNCIDCLDRTNTFQMLIGEIALGIQIAKIQKTPIKYKTLEVDEKVLEIFKEMYENMGDLISEQYGSSIAHKQNIDEQNKGTRFEFITSLKRHFRNNFSDVYRQQQIDLFLGEFIPSENNQLHIWDTQNIITHFPDLSGHSNRYKKDWWSHPLKYFQDNNAITALKRINEDINTDEVDTQIMENSKIEKKQQQANKILNPQNKSVQRIFNINLIQQMIDNVTFKDKKEIQNFKGGINLSIQIPDFKNNFWFYNQNKSGDSSIINKNYTQILLLNKVNDIQNNIQTDKKSSQDLQFNSITLSLIGQQEKDKIQNILQHENNPVQKQNTFLFNQIDSEELQNLQRYQNIERILINDEDFNINYNQNDNFNINEFDEQNIREEFQKYYNISYFEGLQNDEIQNQNDLITNNVFDSKTPKKSKKIEIEDDKNDQNLEASPNNKQSIEDRKIKILELLMRQSVSTKTITQINTI